MSMPDYEIELLLKRREHSLRGNRKEDYCMAYFYTRSIIRYMCRLVFAIGWGEIQKDDNNGDLHRTVYRELLKAPKSSGRQDSIEPGTFWYLLNEMSKSVSKTKEIKPELDILKKLGQVRNYNAHDINNINFKDFYSDSEAIFTQFNNYLSGKICSYIIPVEYVERNELRCEKLEPHYEYPEEIILPANYLDWKKDGNHLFYSITDQDTGNTNFYTLTPFIEVPRLLHDERPHFRVYDRVKDNGYGNSYDVLYYDEVIPSDLEEIDGELVALFKKSTSKFNRSIFLSIENDKSEKIWIPSPNNDLFINLSSYPTQHAVIYSEFKYCTEICPIRSKVISFCKDNKKQVATITGNGGVGKTSLVLSILSEMFNTGSTYNYSNLVFVSAKKVYYESLQTKYHIKHNEEDADIHDYAEFILKIARLLNIDNKYEDISSLANSIVLKINEEAEFNDLKKRFLLILDDLDSLELTDQKSIKEFVYKLDSHVFKTIITTRDIINDSPISFRMYELSENESLLFAKWYVENKLNIPSWHNWSRKKVAISIIKNYGEGNPLNIEVLLTLVKSGYEHDFNAPMTQLERSEYLYSTITNLLDDEEKIVFEICRFLYISVPDDLKSQEMMISVPEYLSAGCEILQEDFNKAFSKLVDLKLFNRSNNQLQFKPYSSFILQSQIIPKSTERLPAMYSLFWENISRNPDNWLAFHDIERKIYNCIIELQSEKNFDNIVARRIIETIFTSRFVNRDLADEINGWLNCHSITAPNRSTEKITRLIQDLEKKWSEYKIILDNMGEDSSLYVSINDQIRELKQLLKITDNKDIKERLDIISREINNYF